MRVIPVGCQSSFNVNYDINSNTTLKYETGNTITANKIINTGANVKFDAGKSITLSPGFTTVSGAVFKAYIDGCGNLRPSAIPLDSQEKPIPLLDKKKVMIKPIQ